MIKIVYLALAGAMAIMASCTQKAADQSAAQESATDTTVAVEATEAEAPAEAEGDVVIALEPGDNIVAGEQPIVVDFWATWCGPCMQFKPVFHAAATKYASKATFASADVDECKALAEKYGINSIPTVLIMMPDGSVKMQTGYMDAAQFDQFLGDIAK